MSIFSLVDIKYLSQHLPFSFKSSWTQLGLAGWYLFTKTSIFSLCFFSLSTFLACVYFLLGLFAPSSLPVPAWCLSLFPSQHQAPGAS